MTVFRLSLPWLALAPRVGPKGHSEAHFEALKLTLCLTLWLSVAHSGSLWLTCSLSGSLWLHSGSRSGSLWSPLADSGLPTRLTLARSGSILAPFERSSSRSKSDSAKSANPAGQVRSRSAAEGWPLQLKLDSGQLWQGISHGRHQQADAPDLMGYAHCRRPLC